MKIYIISLVLMAIAQIAVAQEVLLETTKFQRNGKEFSMRILETALEAHKVEIISAAGDTSKFDVDELEGEAFSTDLEAAIDSLDPPAVGAVLAPIKEERVWSTADLFGKLKDAIENQSDLPIAGWLRVFDHKIQVGKNSPIPAAKAGVAALHAMTTQMEQNRTTEDNIRNQIKYETGKLQGLKLALEATKDSAGTYPIKAKPIRDSIDIATTFIADQSVKLLQVQATIAKLDRDIKILVEQNTSESNLLEPIYLHTKSIQIEFNEGMMEHIVALMEWVDVNNRAIPDSADILFTNYYPVGFSTPRNFERGLHLQRLHCKYKRFSIPLDSLMRFQINSRLNTRDFSPQDTVIIFTPALTDQTLSKGKFADIVKGGAFSDIFGLQEDEPNGLLQFEIDKRINLYTFRHKFFLFPRFFNYSLIQYIKPIATLSKLDGKLRTMPSDYIPTIVNNEVKTTLVSLNTDLLRYENFSAGLDLNLWLLDAQAHKFTFFINFGARFGHVSVADTLREIANDTIVNTKIPNPLSVTTFRYFPEAILEFYPDERLKLSAQYRFSLIYALNESLTQIPREGHTDPTHIRGERALHTLQLGATLKVAPRVEFYVRYRIHMQNKYYKTNFQQAQIGTSFYITKNQATK